MKTLLVTMDFPPFLGGIANYYFNRVSKIETREIVVLMNRVSECPVLASIRQSSRSGSKCQSKVYYKNFFTSLIWPHWLPLIWHVARAVKREKIEMIWVGQVLPVGSAVWVVSKILQLRDPSTPLRSAQDDKKLKFFVTCHGNDLIRAKSVARKYKLAKKILKNAEYVEANTEFTKNILIQDFGIASDKIKIVYPECTLSKDMVNKEKVEELRTKYGLAGKKVLLTVARLVESKGIEQVVKAFSKVSQEMPGLVYLVVGDGPDKKRLINQVGTGLDLSLQDKIIFTGNVSHDELPNYYALSDAFILTPRKNVGTGLQPVRDTESFGIVYLEALEFGLPVIAGDTGGVREVKNDKIVLVDSEDVEEIAEELIKVMK